MKKKTKKASVLPLAVVAVLGAVVYFSVPYMGLDDSGHSSTRPSLDLTDARCLPNAGEFLVYVRADETFGNLSTSDVSIRLDESPISRDRITWRNADAGGGLSADGSTIFSGMSAIAVVGGFDNTTGTSHWVKAIGPVGKAVKLPVRC